MELNEIGLGAFKDERLLILGMNCILNCLLKGKLEFKPQLLI